MKHRVFALGSQLVIALCVACSNDSDSNSGAAGSVGTAGSSGAVGAAGSTTGGGGAASAGASGSASAGSPAGGSSAAGAGGASAGTGGATGGSGGSVGGSGGAAGGGSKATFFVTSDKSTTGNLGGLLAADMRCQKLASAAGITGHTFHAYLSAEKDPADASKAVNAHDRIGAGPWYNSKGVLLAQDLAALHALKGNADLFLDEKGQKINGQWAGSPTPNEHDILTGSDAAGKVVVGKTCSDWTSASKDLTSPVGHSDGLGPNLGTSGTLTSWNAAHEMLNCSNTVPRGGAGRLYCFATD